MNNTNDYNKAKVVINGIEWTIKITDSVDDDKWGLTRTADMTIIVSTKMCKTQQRITIVHELVHAYMKSYGLIYLENFSDEFIAEFTACNIDAIYSLKESIFKDLNLE